ncbi:MAG: ShlB/FhaC/HecB family hemolysin secretion/activation protein [Cyanothece sp. SIO1E1]|nr:ShlB/FhaC/HecB family hemolysin secretion/activation protein [Cyanothece sp. SIO1E1]
MSTLEVPVLETKPDTAARRVGAFASRFGEAHLWLAYHAAFPLALTPNLLYCLWANFQRDVQDQTLDIPWIAVSDLLLSGLCNEVGHELYEMDMAVRNVLLSCLKVKNSLGQQRIIELSDFLYAHVQPQLQSNDPDIRDFAQAQSWAALAYTQSGKAAHELAIALSNAYQQDQADLIRLASLVKTLSEPLAEFESLLIYACGMAKFARGYLDSALAEFDKLHRQGNRTLVAGASVFTPKILYRGKGRNQLEKVKVPQVYKFVGAFALVATVGLTVYQLSQRSQIPEFDVLRTLAESTSTNSLDLSESGPAPLSETNESSSPNSQLPSIAESSLSPSLPIELSVPSSDSVSSTSVATSSESSALSEVRVPEPSSISPEELSGISSDTTRGSTSTDSSPIEADSEDSPQRPIIPSTSSSIAISSESFALPGAGLPESSSMSPADAGLSDISSDTTGDSTSTDSAPAESNSEDSAQQPIIPSTSSFELVPPESPKTEISQTSTPKNRNSLLSFPPSISDASSEENHFVVAVPGNSTTLLNRVRQIEPNATISYSGGDIFVNAGSFPSLAPAESKSQILRERGLDARVIKLHDEPDDISSETIFFSRFEVVGTTVFEPEELAIVAKRAIISTTSNVSDDTAEDSPLINRRLSFPQLLQARSAITEFYTSKGYVTSGALVPPQDLLDEVVTIQVIEGVLEDIEVTVKGQISPEYIKSRLETSASPPLNVPRLEEGLKRLQLEPQIQNISAELAAGSQPGKSILTVHVISTD